MKFGLSGCSGGLEGGDPVRLLELAEWAESLGFTGLWLNEEHFQAPQDGRGRLCLAPITLAAAMAARTTRIRLGFSVLLLPLHQPIRLAEEIATLDLISGGRVDFGVSRGGNAQYYELNGGSPDYRTTDFREGLDLVLRAFGDGTVPLGEREVGVQPKPVQRPHPPVYIGAYSDESVAWAAQQGHRLILHGIQSRESLQRCLQVFTDHGGRREEAPVGRFLYVAESDEAARRDLQLPIEAVSSRIRRVAAQRPDLVASEDQLEPDRFFEEMTIAGSPATCIERIEALRDSLGIDYLNGLSAFFGFLPEDQLRRSLDLFATEVMPHFVTADSTGTGARAVD